MSEIDNQDISELRRELDETRAELQRSLAEQNRLRDVVSSSPDKHRTEEAQALLQASETARDAAQEKFREVSRLLSESVQKNHTLQKQLRSSAEDAKEQAARANLGRELSETRSDLEDHRFALETSEEQVSWLEGELEESEQRVTSLTRQTAGYLAKLRVAQEKLLTLGQAVTERNQLIRTLQDQRQNLTAKCRTWEALHDRLKERNQTLEQEATRNVQELERLRWELGETVSSLDESAHLCSSLQEQVMNQVPASRAQIIQLQSQLRVAEAEIARLRARYETLVDFSEAPASAEPQALSQLRSSSQT